MSVDIKTREFNVIADGESRRVYSVSVVGPDGPIKTKQTTNAKEIDNIVISTLEEYPNATINGESTQESPFTTPGNFSLGKAKGSGPDPGAVPGGSPGLSNKPPPSSIGNLSNRKPVDRKSSKKKAVDLSGLPREKQLLFKQSSKQERIDRGLIGPFCRESMEAMPNRITATGEKIVGFSPSSPAFIVCGRDRPRSSASGYGGKGHTQASCIDLVAGLGGYKPKQVDSSDNIVYTDPDMFLDSARIYISQKTDVDRNFAIGKEDTYFMSEAKSAVAVKADHVRIIGRESLTLATNTDRMNSQGGEIRQWSGIHIMANNDEDGLQPIPRGDNLSKALYRLSVNVENVSKILNAFIEYQSEYNDVVANHTHHSPFFAKPTLPSIDVLEAGNMVNIKSFANSQMSILKTLTNLGGFRHNFLIESGKTYINSRYNKVN